MSPEEARAIEQAEFDADCRAARERAFARIAELRNTRDKRVAAWLTTPPPKGILPYRYRHPPEAPKPLPASLPEQAQRRPRNATPITLTYRGESRTLKEWSELTGISPRTLHSRLSYGWPAERILTESPHGKRHQREPGVGSNFPDIPATGAPSSALDFLQLEFSE